MLYTGTVLGGQKWSRESPCGAGLLPVSWFLSANVVGFRSCTKDFARRPMQRVYLRGRKLRCWACSLEPKPYRSLHNSSNGWPDLHSNNGGGSFAAGRARLSLSLTCRFRNSSRRFMFSRLLIMTAHVRDTPARPGSHQANNGWILIAELYTNMTLK